MASNDLFQLIHSLSGAEKRYFRLFTQRHGQGNRYYLQLFDLVSAQDTYDEVALKAAFAEVRSTKHFASEKSYLREQVLRAMRSYASGKSIQRELAEMLMDQEFLYQKGLLGQAQKLLGKIKTKAREAEQWHYLVEILKREIRLTIEQGKKEVAAGWLKVHEELENSIDLLQEEAGIWGEYVRAFTSYRSEAHHEHGTLPQATSEGKEPSSFQGKTYLLMTQGLMARVEGDFEAFFHHSTALENLWDQHPNHASWNPSQYLKILSNYLNACYLVKRLDLFPSTLKKIKEFGPKDYNFQAEQFQNYYHLRLIYCMNTGDFETGKKLEPEIRKGMELYGEKINKAREFAFYYNLFVLFFFLADFSTARHYLELIMQDKSHMIRKDIQYSARLLLLILHLEMGHPLLLESLYRSTYRFLKKRGKLKEVDATILKFIRRIPDLSDPPQLKDHLLKLKKELLDFSQKVPTKVLGMKEISIWLDSQMTGRSMVELFKENLEEH